MHNSWAFCSVWSQTYRFFRLGAAAPAMPGGALGAAAEALPPGEACRTACGTDDACRTLCECPSFGAGDVVDRVTASHTPQVVATCAASVSAQSHTRRIKHGPHHTALTARAQAALGSSLDFGATSGPRGRTTAAAFGGPAGASWRCRRGRRGTNNAGRSAAARRRRALRARQTVGGGGAVCGGGGAPMPPRAATRRRLTLHTQRGRSVDLRRGGARKGQRAGAHVPPAQLAADARGGVRQPAPTRASEGGLRSSRRCVGGSPPQVLQPPL